MSKNKIDCKFQFYNVGQGLFYTGKIGDFNFVYDCGGDSNSGSKPDYIGNSISKYIEEDGVDKLDMLVLSHIHNDHTNGIDDLLSQTTVDTVILPYLHPIRRVLYALEARTANDWYYDFLINPIKFLLEKGIDRVVVIGGYESVSRTHNDRDDNYRKEWPSNLTIDLESIPNNDKLFNKIKSEEKSGDYLYSSKFLVKQHAEDIRLSNHWVFRFYNIPVTSKKLEDFRDCLEDKDINTNSLRSIIEDIREGERNQNNKQKKLRECYKKIRSKVNPTSLCLYHSPINRSKAKTYFPYFLFNQELLGQMLTGDFDMSTNKNYTNFKTHYQTNINKIKLFQVPHHGSDRNWNTNIIQDIQKCEYFVISSGVARKKHPNKDVVDDILGDKQILFCNEGNKIKITGKC